MEDPLSILRKYVLNKKQILINDDLIIFGNEFFLPGNVKTNYIIYRSDEDEVSKDYYTLKCLVFFLQRINVQHSAYVREAIEAKIQFVHRADRKHLLAFLNGEVSNTERVDKYASINALIEERPLITRSEKISVIKKRHATDTIEEMNKRRRLDHVHQPSMRLDINKENALLNDLTLNGRNFVINVFASNYLKQRSKLSIQAISEGEEDVIFMNTSKKGIINKNARNMKNCNRTTILQSNNKEFASKTLRILRTVQQNESNDKKNKNPQQLKTGICYNESYQNNPSDLNDYDKFKQKFNDNIEKTINSTLKPIGSTVNNSNQHTHKNIFEKLADNNFTYRNKSTRITPIIIIPNSNASLITSVNAVDILQNLKFISKDEKLNDNSIKKNKNIFINRLTPDGHTEFYRVVDDPLQLHIEEWKKVIAIFVVGTTWQFKNWPIYYGNPIDIFSNVAAFHLKYDDTPLNKSIDKWNINVININRTKQHWNRAALMEFWLTLDKEEEKKKKFWL